MPIKTRLTLLFAAVMSAAIATAGLFVYHRFTQDQRLVTDDRLRARAEFLFEGIEEGEIRFQEQTSLIGSEQEFAEIILPDGRVIISPPAEGRITLPGVRLQGPRFFSSPVDVGDREVDARLLASPAPRGALLIVGTTLEESEQSAQRLAILLSLGGAALLTVSTLVAWMVAGSALSRVDQMRAEAASITAGRPRKRLAVPRTRDEIARLGETLNEMLDRLEQAFEREQRFVNDASHELRTPLGILRTELELALRRSRTQEELEAAIRSATEETDRLARLADDLLVLARADHGTLPIRRAPVDLAALVDRVATVFSARAEARGVAISRDVSAAPSLSADPDRLRQVVENLVDNAIRHTPQGGKIHIAAARRDGSAVISVSDTGKGFPEDLLDDAFSPFRGDARSTDGSGAGLGLAIARTIVEAHGGSASARNLAPGGAEVRIQLPL